LPWTRVRQPRTKAESPKQDESPVQAVQ
jgi:hypothetical protein